MFTLPSNQVNVIEDVEDTSASPGSPTTFNNFATNIAQAAGLLLTPPLGPTASDEASQILRFDILSVSAPELFEIQPTISPAGQLSFRTADHKNGKAVVVVDSWNLLKRLVRPRTQMPRLDKRLRFRWHRLMIRPV